MKAIIATLLIGLAATTASAAPPYEILERALETDSVALELPASTAGSLWVTGCSSCPRLGLSSESQYFVDTTPVSFAQLKQILTTGTLRSVVVYYKTDDTRVTRIVALKP